MDELKQLAGPVYMLRYQAAKHCGISNYILRRMIDRGEVALHLINCDVHVDVNEVMAKIPKAFRQERAEKRVVNDLFSAA